MKIPKISSYFITYNSELILPHLLRHYSAFCEKITIIDNCSTDFTPLICSKFGNVQYHKYDTCGTFNDGIISVIKNNIWKQDIGKFDYIILGDNDEFLYHSDILNFIKEKEKLGYTIFRPFGYHMIGDYDLNLTENDDIFKKIQYGCRIKSMDKQIGRAHV
jgi:glycosyltransferase involved in cell wall biosynthesis